MKLTGTLPAKFWAARAGLADLNWVRAGLVLVFLVGAIFRFTGLDWDSGRNLHPDERFLTTITNDLAWPDSFASYFDPNTSSLSPYSLPSVGLFVYGTFPIYLVKWTAIQLDRNTYDLLPLTGRALSALFDLGAVGFLFLIGRRLYGRHVALLASAFLSLSVLNIQLSHFYTVDTFANLFVLAAFYFLLRAASHGRWIDFALLGLCLGLGLASKISVLTLAAPILVGIWIDFTRRLRSGTHWGASVEQSLVRMLTVLAAAALVFRLVQPAAFAGPTFWNWTFNPRWLRDIAEQASIASGNTSLPWLLQWVSRPVSFVLYNLVVWGLGVPLGLAGVAGLGFAGYELVVRRRSVHLLPVIFVLATFLYYASQFVKFMRYFLPIYPFLALLAAYLLVWVWRRSQALDVSVFSRRLSAQAAALGLVGVVLGSTLLYVLAFSTIYARPHTRVQASRWMYTHIPPGSTLANEHWDDWLPIGGLDGKTAYGEQGLFNAVEMENYIQDTPEKLVEMVSKLEQADYLVLSSNRLYGSIPRQPLRYPLITRYYELLFSGELGFELAAEFSSYPSLLGLRLFDQAAEESFTVYDHPRVQIFKKTAAFDAGQVHSRLGSGIEWPEGPPVTPRQASLSPTGLRLSASQQQRYQQAATWSSTHVNDASLGSRLPLLAWFLAVQAVGLLALPLMLVTFQGLNDRGYIFSKAAGLLLAAWASWTAASSGLALPFTRWQILVMLGLLGLLSGWLLRVHHAELAAFLRARWRWLLVNEALFWGLFTLALTVRWLNPDLWHPFMGGEKPMDLAYLNAVVRTPFFPPYDPWFSGGFINYYYFGFVLAAVLVHLTGIPPTAAYNLAVPTFFAMTAMGSFAVAYNLAAGWRPAGSSTIRGAPLLAGLCGMLFVALIGNLGQVHLIFDGIRSLSVLEVGDSPSPFVLLAQFSDGLVQWWGGQPMALRTEWWYWNATRIIPAGPGEAGPINEMPLFTFLFADLHAHLMALPYTLLAIALALNLLLAPPVSADKQPASSRIKYSAGALSLFWMALVVGALWVLNTWDLPTYSLIAAAALGWRAYAQRGRVDGAALWAWAWRLVLVVGGGWLLFAPFHSAYASSSLGFERWAGTRTPLWAYLEIHGFFLFLLGSYLAAELIGGSRHGPFVRSLRLLRRWRRLPRLRRLFRNLVRPQPAYQVAVWGSLAAVAGLIVLLFLNRVLGLALGMLLLTLALAASSPAPRHQFVLTLVGLGLALTLLVELFVLRSDISRMNTVFKFYLQTWVLWAVAAAAVLPQLAGRLRAAAAANRRLAGGWRPRDWWVVFTVLLLGCLLYPLTAVPARISDRFENSPGMSLDGASYMRSAVYFDQEQGIPLDWDRQAMEWLRQNVRGLPVILEANTPLYRWGGRVSIYTGLPTVIGWDWHQKQQRSALPGELVDRRIADVAAIYTSPDPHQALELLNRYGVRYVYLGSLERVYYGEIGLNTFQQAQGQLWDLVYQNEQVQIYQVR